MKIKCSKCETVNSGQYVSSCKCCGQRLQSDIQAKIEKREKEIIEEKKSVNRNIYKEDISVGSFTIRFILYLIFFEIISNLLLDDFLAKYIPPIVKGIVFSITHNYVVLFNVAGIICITVISLIELLLVIFILNILFNKYIIEKNQVKPLINTFRIVYIIIAIVSSWLQYNSYSVGNDFVNAGLTFVAQLLIFCIIKKTILKNYN